MATTDITHHGKVTDTPIEGQTQAHRPWHRIALLAILIISALLNFFDLQKIGYGNTYYAAAVRSMLDSWHNFFFVSFDPGGYVTIDKPPVGFWLQALSAKIFGFNGVSLLLPSALAGVASVALLYYLVRRYFGPIAGLIAALALALTPISVVINRDNNVDGILVLALLAGAWAVSRASETGNLRWLLLSAVFVGLGFNIKSLEAYLVVPAFGLMYLLGAPISWRARILHLVLATLVLLIISLSWMTIVDLTPASQRPYVGSSQTNSELELALGYNGVERLVGGIFNRGGARRTTSATNTSATQQAEAQQAAFGGPGGAGENGAAGPLRLIDSQIGGQISWLLPLAILGLIVAAWQTRIRLSLNRKQQALVLWGMELLTMGIFYSIASFYHTYYMTTMAPAISALAGIGIVALWQEYRREDWRGWMLPLVLLITAGVQMYILTSYASWTRILMAVIAVLVLVAALVLSLARLNIALSLTLRGTPTQAMVVVGLITLLLAPGIWSFITVYSSNGGALPTAGPRAVNASGFPGGGFPGVARTRNTNRGARGEGFRGGAGGFGGGFGGSDVTQTDTKLIQYLEANQGSTRYLLATTNATSASPFILATNKPVMALGGFLGTDPILTQQKLATLVSNGTVRYFLIQGGGGANQLPSGLSEQQREQLEELFGNGGGGGGFGGFGASSLTSWVTQHCSIVPTSQWQSSTQSGNAGGFGGGQQLYDCKAA